VGRGNENGSRRPPRASGPPGAKGARRFPRFVNAALDLRGLIVLIDHCRLSGLCCALQNPPHHRVSTLPESQAQPRGSATSAITLLALASFAAQAMVRVTDSLLRVGLPSLL